MKYLFAFIAMFVVIFVGVFVGNMIAVAICSIIDICPLLQWLS